MTIAEQIEHSGFVKGRQEGECSLILRQLYRKFHNISEKYQQCLAQADEETLLMWGDRILEATTLEDIFEE